MPSESSDPTDSSLLKRPKVRAALPADSSESPRLGGCSGGGSALPSPSTAAGGREPLGEAPVQLPLVALGLSGLASPPPRALSPAPPRAPPALPALREAHRRLVTRHQVTRHQLAKAVGAQR